MTDGAGHLLSIAGCNLFMKFGVLAFLDCSVEPFIFLYFFARFFVLRQGKRQLLDDLPRMPRMGAGQVCACSGLANAANTPRQSPVTPELHLP